MKSNKLSVMGEKIIKHNEGFSLDAYLDSGGVPTIGWGTTVYPNGSNVKLGDKCTVEQAESYFQHDKKRFENNINSKLTVDVNQNQFDALMIFFYNTGGSHNIIEMINNKCDTYSICKWWMDHYITVNGKATQGLVNRREKEAKLFATPV